MHLHATVRAWQREEDGSYKAEIDGHLLYVSWHPETADGRRGFSWKVRLADQEGGPELRSEERAEEIELAMAQAEHAVRKNVVR